MFQCAEGVIKPIVYVGIIKNQKLLLVQYHQPPNPNKSGWWIPAPGLEFGQDPMAAAVAVVNDLGLSSIEMKLQDVESFVTPGGWHLISHFVGATSDEPQIQGNIKAIRWVSAQELSDMNDIAHGKWEIEVGKSYFAADN